MRAPNAAIARVTHAFTASAERAFDAWLDAEKVPLWWRVSAAAAGRGATETVERVRIDARVGGTFSFLVRREGKLIDHTGTYLEIDRPRHLVFTWAAVEAEQQPPPKPDYSRVIIDIAPLPRGCEVTLMHEMSAEYADFVDRAVRAWTFMLEAIDEILNEQPA